MIVNSGENNPFDSLDKISGKMDSEKMNEVSREIEESRDIYDQCNEFLEKTVLDIINQSPTSLTQPKSIPEHILLIDLTKSAKAQITKLRDFNHWLKNEEPKTKEEKQHKLEQKTNQINELLKNEIGALDHTIQNEMQKAVDGLIITTDTSKNVDMLIDYKITNHMINENTSNRLTFFAFKSMGLDEASGQSFNKLDELLPHAKGRIKQLPIIFQSKMFNLIPSQQYSLTHLERIESHLHYYESLANLKDPSQMDLVHKIFDDSLFQSIHDKTSLQLHQKVLDLFEITEDQEEIHSLMQILTNSEGEIHPIMVQCLIHIVIKKPFNKVFDDLKTLRNLVPDDFESEISEWQKLGALLTKNPQLAQLMIINYQNNPKLLDYFLTNLEKIEADATWFIQEIEKIPANFLDEIKKNITNLSSKQLNLMISLWKKVGDLRNKGSITQVEFVNTLQKLISLAKVRAYLLELLNGLDIIESELLYKILSEIPLEKFSLIKITSGFIEHNKADLFDELVEQCPSYIDIKKLFLMSPDILIEFKRVLAHHLGKTIDQQSAVDIYSKMDSFLWGVISRLVTLDPKSRQKILEGDKEFSSMHFLDEMTKIYEKSPLTGDYFLEFHRKYPSQSSLLTDLVFKIGINSFEKLLKTQDPLLDDHMKQFLGYADLDKEKLKELCNMYELNPSLTALCLKIPPKNGKDIIKFIPEYLEFIPPTLINEWTIDPVFLLNTVVFLANHSNNFVMALKKITSFNSVETMKVWISLFQFDMDGIIFSSQRSDFFDLALPLLKDPGLHVSPALMFDALLKIEKKFPVDFGELIKRYDNSVSNKVRNILDIVQMGEMDLASILCQEVLEPNRVSIDIKKRVLYNLSDALNSEYVLFYQRFIKLDPVRDRKLLMWIENITKNERVVTQEISSLLELHEYGENKLVNALLNEFDPKKSNYSVRGVLQTVLKQMTSDVMDNSIRRQTLVSCIQKGETALACHIFVQKQAFWEINQSENKFTNSLRVQESLWNLVGDYAPKEIPHSLEKYLKTILSSQVSEKECVLALGYLQYVIKQDPAQLDQLTVFSSADGLKDFVINCDATNPRKIFLEAMPSEQEMKNFSGIEREKIIEYRLTIALAKCIVTRRGSLNTALLSFFGEEICTIYNIPSNSSFVKHLNHVFNDFTRYREEYTQILQQLIDPARAKQIDNAELIVRSIKQKNHPAAMTKMDYLESVVSAVLSQSRQADNRGNCFAMQTMILTESDHKGLINSLKDYVELLVKGKLVRQAIGDEYPLIIDQGLIDIGCGHPLQSSRAYTIAQMFTSLKVDDTLGPSLELLNSEGVVGQYIDSTIHQNKVVQDVLEVKKFIHLALNRTLFTAVNPFYSLEFQVPGTRSIGAWILQNTQTGVLIDSDDKYIELLKCCCKSALSIIPKAYQDIAKTIFETVEKFIDSPQQRSAIINFNQKADPTKIQHRWIGKSSGGDGLQIRKRYNDQPNFSFERVGFDTSSEEKFLIQLDTLMDLLPTQRVKEKVTTGFSKLPIGVRKHDCNLNIGILLRKKTSSSASVVDQMKKEGDSVLQQPITFQKTDRIIFNISQKLKLNYIQQEKLVKYVTENQPDTINLDFLTQRIEEWLTNYYANHEHYSKQLGILDQVIKNTLLEDHLKVPEVLVLFDSNWIAKDHNNVEYGYTFNLMSKSLKSVCLNGFTQIPCTPTSFTDGVQITSSFE